MAEGERTERSIGDFESDIIGDFFDIETLATLGAKMFDNAGKTSTKTNLDGSNILGMIDEKISKIKDNLEDQLELIEAEDKTEGKEKGK